MEQPTADHEHEIHPVTKALAAIPATATVIFSLWCTIIAFTGGTLPLVGWNIDGGVGTGLLWIFIIDPIVVTVGCWVSTLIALPIELLLSRRSM